MRKIPVIIFSVVAVLSNVAHAETLKEKANRICRAYIDKPQDFHEIKTVPCEINPSIFSYDNKGNCFEHVDKETKIVRKFSTTNRAGTCHSVPIVEIENNNEKDLPLRNANVNGYGMGAIDKPLLYKGELLFTAGGDLRLPLVDDTVILCQVINQLDGWKPAEPLENDICKKFGNDQFKINSTAIDKLAWDSWPKFPEAVHESPEPVLESVDKVDLDSDGETEEILTYQISSGRGCGCGASALTVFQDGKILNPEEGVSASEKNTGLAEELMHLTWQCGATGRPSTIVEINGKNYVMIGYVNLLGRDNKFIQAGNMPVRDLYEFKSGKFEKICSQEASSSEKVIVHESYKGQKSDLTYVPLE